MHMTDNQYKQVTAKFKALADLRVTNLDDVDALLRAFHRGIPLTEVLPNMTEAEKEALAGKAGKAPSNGVSNEEAVTA